MLNSIITDVTLLLKKSFGVLFKPPFAILFNVYIFENLENIFGERQNYFEIFLSKDFKLKFNLHCKEQTF